MTFEEFIDYRGHSQWVREPGINIYMRKPLIASHGDIELANMSADSPGKGALTRFLNKYESICRFYVENIFNERLIAYLERRGYRITISNGQVCALGRKI